MFAYLIAILLMVSGAQAAPPDADGWTQLYDKNGITGFRRVQEGSPFYEWRGQGYIDANFYRVVAVYMDSNRSTEWVADCLESSEVTKPDIDHQVTYNRTNLPAPIWDRDFLWAEAYVYDTETRTVVDTMESIEMDEHPVRSGIVRGRVLNSTFVARWDAPDRTWVVVTLHLDPGGSLPAWLVNMFARAWPFETFTSLREQVYTATGYDDLEAQIRAAHPMDPPPATD